MIEYVVEQNTDDRILSRASQILRNGGLLCFPTETNWVAVADPFNPAGVEKLYRLRHVENTKHFAVLCSSFQRAMEIAVIEDHAFRLMKKVTPGPYTFILQAQKKITKHLKASRYDHQVGIRFPPREICRTIMQHYDGVLLSTHIGPKMLDLEEDTFLYSALIEDYFGSLLDLIIDPGETEFVGPTTIIDFTSGAPELIREGAGKPDVFLR